MNLAIKKTSAFDTFNFRRTEIEPICESCYIAFDKTVLSTFDYPDRRNRQLAIGLAISFSITRVK
jgi:hypothetical protein